MLRGLAKQKIGSHLFGSTSRIFSTTITPEKIIATKENQELQKKIAQLDSLNKQYQTATTMFSALQSEKVASDNRGEKLYQHQYAALDTQKWKCDKLKQEVENLHDELFSHRPR